MGGKPRVKKTIVYMTQDNPGGNVEIYVGCVPQRRKVSDGNPYYYWYQPRGSTGQYQQVCMDGFRAAFPDLADKVSVHTALKVELRATVCRDQNAPVPGA